MCVHCDTVMTVQAKSDRAELLSVMPKRCITCGAEWAFAAENVSGLGPRVRWNNFKGWAP